MLCKTYPKFCTTLMLDQEYLKYCLLEIEKKLSWKSSQLWKESDYVKLSKIIYEESNISISTHTLKRLFGKIKYKKYYNPQQATKDALSKFLGFLDWDDFVKNTTYKIEKKVRIDVDAKHNNTFKQKIFTFAILASVMIFGIIFVHNEYVRNAEKIEPFAFHLNDSIGSVPFTVSTNYNISKISSDSVFIDFNFIHPYRGKQIINPSKNSSTINFTYQIPGYYRISLIKDQDTLSSKSVLAISDRWDSYLFYDSKPNLFWLDNKIKIKPDSLGFLYYSTKRLALSGFDTSKVFYITHRLYKSFNIDGDNFEFETKFKNPKALGGITCYDFILKLICENTSNHLNLMEHGCSQYSGVKFGETVLNGSQQNLSDFKLNPEQWNVLYISVKQKHVEIFINDKSIYKADYERPNGKIMGIENVFKGTGILDYIKIKDLKSGQVFLEEF